VKFYNSLGPNPRLVRMFMLEKGIELPLEEVDIMAGENRQAGYLSKNPAGELPALELDDGSVIAETTVICEYLEDQNPEPPLIGSSANARANVRMWTRRVELAVTGPMTDAFRSGAGQAMFKDRRHLIPEAVADWQAIGQEGLTRLDEQIAGRDFIAGDSLSLADIVAYCLLDFAAAVGQPIDPSNKNVLAWFERIGSRPSAEESIHPAAAAGGMRA
jgi:glutathione S-transferase